MQTLARLEREYLLRTSVNGQLVEGLHPIRSSIIVELLTDPVLEPWLEAAKGALRMMAEDDIENFLLYAFSRHTEQIEALLQQVNALVFRAWTGRAGVLRALLWLGVREHLTRLRPQLDEMQRRFGDAWQVMVLWDIVNLRSWYPELNNINLDILDRLSNEFQAARAELRQYGVEDPAAFKEARNWLAHQEDAPEVPANVADWAGVSEIVFWAGFWRLPPYDPTTQTGVSVTYLSPEWALKWNRTFGQLAGYTHRPNNWQTYISCLMELRAKNLEQLTALRRGLDLYFRKHARTDLFQCPIALEQWEETRDGLNRSLQYPQVAVDEWGLAGEQIKSNIQKCVSWPT